MSSNAVVDDVVVGFTGADTIIVADSTIGGDWVSGWNGPDDMEICGSTFTASGGGAIWGGDGNDCISQSNNVGISSQDADGGAADYCFFDNSPPNDPTGCDFEQCPSVILFLIFFSFFVNC